MCGCILAIVGAAEAEGRKELALKLANTDLDAKQACDIMSAAAVETPVVAKKKSVLDSVMAQEENNPKVQASPAVATEPEASEEDIDAYVNQLKAMGEL